MLLSVPARADCCRSGASFRPALIHSVTSLVRVGSVDQLQRLLGMAEQHCGRNDPVLTYRVAGSGSVLGGQLSIHRQAGCVLQDVAACAQAALGDSAAVRPGLVLRARQDRPCEVPHWRDAPCKPEHSACSPPGRPEQTQPCWATVQCCAWDRSATRRIAQQPA